MPKTVRQIERVLRKNGWTLARTVGSHRQFVHPDNPNVVTVPGAPGKRVATGTLLHPASQRNRRTAMTEYLAIYERNDDGWWAYMPDLPGCTAAGNDRDEVERNARTAVAAHLELLRTSGRPVPVTDDARRKSHRRLTQASDARWLRLPWTRMSLRP